MYLHRSMCPHVCVHRTSGEGREGREQRGVPEREVALAPVPWQIIPQAWASSTKLGEEEEKDLASPQ